eukprot:CAMPEP_0181334050 /NCGR_PEP_ID=MMETSP1101-20121128/26037_1 /TAXON_ID=46948 /ORGANISM="Rhodomonas abbreviata, Strain Caron Lab Isolate" /LENGTH=557 /DNA_ID=CAMNT_0023443969 /DNA_START=297 /DNA_END=1970 /DNA_ORIENTATION=-
MSAIGLTGGGLALYAAANHYGISVADIINPPKREAIDLSKLEIPKPPDNDNEHPFMKRSWFFRAMFVLKRAVYLVAIFTPFAAVSMYLAVMPDDKLRTYWLNMMVTTLETAGCSFMKFGQWLSMRPDLLPQDVIEALARLRNDAPSHDFAHTRRAIKDSFGKEIEEIFEVFEETPVASGTIAQVHRAVLRPEHVQEGGSREVAVKVRHPHVIKESYIDTRLLFDALDIVGTVLQLSSPFDKDSFNRALQRQVDLQWEAYNLQLFNWNFKGEEFIKFPRVASHLVSQSVLTETWVNGKVVQDIFCEVGENFIAIEHKAEATLKKFSDTVMAHKKKLAKVVFDMNMKMFLRDNYVHGDLHGGNLMAADDGTLAVFDAGLTTALKADIAEPFGYFLHAICTGSTDKVVDKLILFNEVPREKIDVPAFREDVRKRMGIYVGDDGMHSPAGGAINMGELIGCILNSMQVHKMRLRGDVAVTMMTMAISESLIRQLDPEFDVVKNALPYFVRFRSWKLGDTDLKNEVWKEEKAALNGGLPIGEEAEEKRKRQITSYDAVPAQA